MEKEGQAAVTGITGHRLMHDTKVLYHSIRYCTRTVLSRGDLNLDLDCRSFLTNSLEIKRLRSTRYRHDYGTVDYPMK